MKKFFLLATFALVLTLALMPSCNVTRTVTTSSSFFQNGDTTTQITTKTIESYDASKKH